MNLTNISFSKYIFIFISILIDYIGLFISLKLSIGIYYYFTDHINFMQSINSNENHWIIILTILMFINEKIYSIRYDFWADTKKVLKSTFLTLIIVFTLFTLTKISNNEFKTIILLYFVIASFFIPFIKRVSKKFLFLKDYFKINVKVVAKEKYQSILKKEFEDNWYLGLKVHEQNYDMVLISSKDFDIEKLESLIRKFTKRTKDIFVIPYINHLDFSQATIVDYSNVRLSAIHIENRLLNYKNLFIKYFSEKLLVLILLPFVLMVHILISILIKIDSKGSIIFKQKRFGKNAKPFSCYKYRTMYEDNQNILNKYLENRPDEVEYYNTYHKYKSDPRITPIGKFLRKTSLDEIPQFFNVLRGDMNLIGPRPYMLNEKDKIGKNDEAVILEVKPGITGLWQVSGRNELTFSQRLELDKWYIQNWSLWLDFVIFVKTIKVVFSKVGAR
jgi:undecaprenyl-phosphate galactose phosphotransferase